jgi:DNA-binding FadR family transcriptional regulator
MSGKQRPMRVQRIRKAYEQVADQLLAMITAGELSPGDRLPSEAELARDFGVSRTTVREALRILATRSLIHTRKGMAGGHFIVHPSVEGLTDFLVAHYGLLTALNTVTLENLLEAREALEAPAAALAALRRDDDDLRRLRETVPDNITELSTAQAFEHNRDFHYHVLAATKNPLMVVAGRPIYLVLQASAVRRQPAADVVRAIAEQHNEIIDAITAKDSDRARRVMEDHLTYLRRNYQPGDSSDLSSTEGFDLLPDGSRTTA